MIVGRPTATWSSWEEPDPGEHDLADRLLDMRIVHLGGALDEALANRGIAQLLLLDRRGSSPIELHLGCAESELDASLALAGTVQTVSAPVQVIVRGSLVGPAAAVLCAGRERGAHMTASIVLSVPDATAHGTAEQMTVHAEHHERQLARLRDHIVRATGRTAEAVDEDLRRGRVLSAEDAREYGLLTRFL